MALGLLLGLPAALAADPPPNIVVILTDDLGFSDIASYGGEIETPHLDRLAGAGVRFSQFYVTPRCSPTRASLLTGLYSHEVGIGHLNQPWGRPGYLGELSREVPTLAELLQSVGYRTYMSGKWHLSHNPRPERSEQDVPSRLGWPRARGFDRVFGTIRGSGSFYDPASLVRDDDFIGVDRGFFYTDAISDEAAGFVREHAASKSGPFFLYLSYSSPHWPLHAAEEDVREYAGRFDAGWDVLRRERRQRLVELGLIDPGWELAPLEPRAVAWDAEPHKAWQARRMETYAAMVDRMDRGIGRVLAAIEAAGAWDDTLIVFLSDNGGNAEEFQGINRLGRWLMPVPEVAQRRFGDDPEVMPGGPDTFQTYGPGWSSLSNTPFRRGKHWAHEGGIATPLIVHWPAGLGVEPGSLIHAPGHVVDLVPTFLEVASLAYPTRFADRPSRPLRGESLVPLLLGRQRERGPMYWAHEGNRGMRDGRFKLVSDWPGDWELYDMKTDRTELYDLAEQQPQRVAEMARRYERFAREAQVGTWPWVARPFRIAVWSLSALVLVLVVGIRFWWRRRSSRAMA